MVKAIRSIIILDAAEESKSHARSLAWRARFFAVRSGVALR
jgi:hypothetical protein